MVVEATAVGSTRREKAAGIVSRIRRTGTLRRGKRLPRKRAARSASNSVPNVISSSGQNRRQKSRDVGLVEQRKHPPAKAKPGRAAANQDITALLNLHANLRDGERKADAYTDQQQGQ